MDIGEKVDRLWKSFKEILPVGYCSFDSYQQLEDYIKGYVKSGSYNFHSTYISEGDWVGASDWEHSERAVPASRIMELLPNHFYGGWPEPRYHVIKTPFGMSVSFRLSGLSVHYRDVVHVVVVTRNYLSEPAASPAPANC